MLEAVMIVAPLQSRVDTWQDTAKAMGLMTETAGRHSQCK